MTDLKYELLVELNSRMEADLLKSYLEAQGIPVEVFQESVGHSIYPVALPGLGSVQVFVANEKIKQAQSTLKIFMSEGD
jgi:hypothetical protein